jgi:hypothetical protein
VKGDSVLSKERSEVGARRALLHLAAAFDARKLFALPPPEARQQMARVVAEDTALRDVVAGLTAESEEHLRKRPRTEREIGQDAAWDLGVSSDLPPGENAGPSAALGLDELFDDIKILQVQNALLWMRRRDRVGGGLRRDYALALGAIALGVIAWLGGLASWADAPISMFAFMVGVAFLTAGSYQWHASSWLARGLIARDFRIGAKVAFFALIAAALSLLTLALGPWTLPLVARICSAGVGLAAAFSAVWALERGSKIGEE